MEVLANILFACKYLTIVTGVLKDVIFIIYSTQMIVHGRRYLYLLKDKSSYLELKVEAFCLVGRMMCVVSGWFAVS